VGKGYFIPLFGIHLGIAVIFVGERPRRRYRQGSGEVSGVDICIRNPTEWANMTIIERSKVSDKVYNSAGHE